MDLILGTVGNLLILINAAGYFNVWRVINVSKNVWSLAFSACVSGSLCFVLNTVLIIISLWLIHAKISGAGPNQFHVLKIVAYCILTPCWHVCLANNIPKISSRLILAAIWSCVVIELLICFRLHTWHNHISQSWRWNNHTTYRDKIRLKSIK